MNIKVPTSWKHVSIKQYNEYKTLCQRNLEAVEHVAHAVSIMCKLDLKTVYSIPVKDVKRAYELMQFLYLPTNEVFYKKLFMVGSYFYRIIDPSTATANQYMACKEYSKPEVIEGHLSSVVACYVVRIGKKFSEKEFEFNKKYFEENMSVHMANGLALFFYQYYNELNQIILDYSLKKSQTDLLSMMESLRSDGVGGLHSTI